MATTEKCEICKKENMRYKCPKCNILYCTVQCYKSPEHLKCSEEFYKNCIQEELATGEQKSREDMQKIIDILKRMHETDAGMSPNFSGDSIEEEDEEQLDSDDEVPAGMGDGNDDDDDVDEDLAVRLKGVDLNNADEVWDRMTAAERKEFENMIETGDIMKFIPNYKPWWLAKKLTSKIVDITVDTTKTEDKIMPKPEIYNNIPKFSSICKVTPSPCLHYNLWNIMAAYSAVVRFYANEHQTNPIESVSQLVNLCLIFKCGTNFEDVDDAVTSVQMEALTTRHENTVAGSNIVIGSREELLNDARFLMSSRSFKLAALSDILLLFKKAKQELKSSKNADLLKLFALCSGSIELDRKKCTNLIKKIEFLLSYVNRDADNDLK